MGFIGIKAAKSDFNAVIAKTIRKYRKHILEKHQI